MIRCQEIKNNDHLGTDVITVTILKNYVHKKFQETSCIIKLSIAFTQLCDFK